MNFPSPNGFPFSAIVSHNSKLSFLANSKSFLQLVKHLAVFLHNFSSVKFCPLVPDQECHQTGRVLSCVMAFYIIFFHNCNRILADEVDNSLVIWDNKISRAPFTVENLSFIISLSLLGCLHLALPGII